MTKKEFTCDVIKADQPTANGNIYSKEALQKLVSQINDQAWAGRAMAVVDEILDGRVNLKDVVGKVDHAELRGDKMVFTIELLPTPRGKELKELLLSPGVSVAPKMRGHVHNGRVDPDSLKFEAVSFVLDNKSK